MALESGFETAGADTLTGAAAGAAVEALAGFWGRNENTTRAASRIITAAIMDRRNQAGIVKSLNRFASRKMGASSRSLNDTRGGVSIGPGKVTRRVESSLGRERSGAAGRKGRPSSGE